MSRARMRLNLRRTFAAGVVRDEHHITVEAGSCQTTSATALRNASRDAASEVRHWTSKHTTLSFLLIDRESHHVSLAYCLDLMLAANSRSSGHTLRPLTRMRSLLRPATTSDCRRDNQDHPCRATVGRQHAGSSSRRPNTQSSHSDREP